jgi:hypothetical protein
MSDKDTFKIEFKRSNMLLYFYYGMLVISIIWVIVWGVLLEEARGSGGGYNRSVSNYGVVDAIEAGACMILGAIFIHLFAVLIYKEYFKRQIKGMTSKKP